MKKKILISTGGTGGHVIPANVFFEHLKNDFEYFARKEYPEINEIFNLMSQYGTVELSGTGSSMYLNFNSSEEAYTIATKVPTNCKFFVTRSLDKSPIYDELNK